jgi:predicted permease
MRPRGTRRLFRFTSRTAGDIHADIADEMAFHVEMRVETLRRDGLSEAEARAQASREFGDPAAHDAVCAPIDGSAERRSRWRRLAEECVQDLRVGLRLLLRSPGFAAAAICTLALSIGANTAIYSLLDAVLLRPVPLPEPGRLALIWETRPDGGTNSASGGAFLDWRSNQTQFDAIVLMNPVAQNLSGRGATEQLKGMEVSHEFLQVLGVPAVIGRGFLPAEDQPGGPSDVVMITEEFWRSRFGADTAILGQRLVLDDVPRTVIGVLPRAAWIFPTDTFFIPAVLMPGTNRVERSPHWAAVFGRLSNRSTFAAADAELKAIKARLNGEYPAFKRDWSVRAQPVSEALGLVTRTPMLLLLGAVSVLLLIACANVANLVLARGRHREQELATRAALGAGSARLARQLLTESVVLALLGGVVGVVLAAGGVRVLRSIAAGSLPIALTPQLNLRVLMASAGITLITGLLFGLVPALRARRPDLSLAINNGGRRATAAGQHRTQSMLVVTQVALTMVLLAAAGLLLRSLANTTRVDPGFDAERVLAFDVALPKASYDAEAKRVAFATTMIGRLRAVPGIEQAGSGQAIPFSGGGSGEYFQRPGTGGDEGLTLGRMDFVSSGYLEALGARVRAGRLIAAGDTTGSGARVAVISETTARRFFPRGDAVGQVLRIQADEWRVVGVIADIVDRRLDGERKPFCWVPYVFNSSRMSFAVRTPNEPLSLVGSVRRELAAVDPGVALANPRALEQTRAGSLTQRRVVLGLVSAFAAAALLLACVGIYGVMAYGVATRRREIGIRLALGAVPTTVVREELAGGVSPLLLGLGLGTLGALVAARLLASELYGVKASDPTVLVITALTIATAAMGACLIPAWRATKYDPLESLRAE